MATKDNFFRTSDGLWLYYEDVGQGDPIILLPGFQGSSKSWRYTVPVLAKENRVICLDPRGHGRSMKVAGNNNLDRMALDIRELIDHLGLENVMLVGHSLGGSQAAHYAESQNQYRLSGVCLVDATLYGFSDEPWNQHACNHYNIDRWLDRMTPYMSDFVAYAEKAMGKYTHDCSLSPEMTSYFKELQDDMAKIPPWCGIEFHLSTYHTDNMTPLKNRTIPVAVFVADSPYHNATQSGLEAIRRMVNCPLPVLYQYESGNHMFPILEKDKFNADLLDFLARVKDYRTKKS